MFEIYKFGFDAGFWDEDYLQDQVNQGSLSEIDYRKIVGDSDDEHVEAQPEA